MRLFNIPLPKKAQLGDERTIRIDGSEIDPASPVDAVRAGIAYLSEDRQNAGTIQSFGLTENITLISLRKYCRGLFIRKNEEEEAAASV